MQIRFAKTQGGNYLIHNPYYSTKFMRLGLEQFLWRWRVVLLITPVVAALVLLSRAFGWLQPLEIAALDQFFQARPQQAVDDRIVIVEITEADIRSRGYPINDRTLAQLLQNLKQQQPRVIGLDIFRDLPVGEGQDELAKVFETTPNLIGIRKVVADRASGAVVNPPPILNKLGQVAANDLIADADGKIRRILLGLQDKTGQQISTLGAELALRYLAVQGVAPEVIDRDNQQIQLGKAQFVPLKSNDGGYVNIDDRGYQLLGKFRNLRAGFRSISFNDALEGRFPEPIRDRVVLIGITAESAGDFFLTSYSRSGNNSINFSGVSIHAEAVSQILRAALEGDAPIRFWSDWVEIGCIVVAALIGTSLSWGLHTYHIVLKRKKHTLIGTPLITLSTIALLSAVLLGGGYVAFLQGWWVPVMAPILALTASSLVTIGYVAQLSDKMRQTFGRYLTDEVATNLLETRKGLKLGGEKRKVTILISDLRGFSAISDRINPETAVQVINQYLEVMIDVVNQYKGILNEVVGDGLFIFFGAPIQREDDTQRAIACAISMQLAMQKINAQLVELDLPELSMGIGLHTGEVLAGNIGSERRAKYTIMGSHVNMASRIESYTVGGQILASQALLKEVGEVVRVDQQLQVQLKGFSEVLKLYEIGGIGGRFNLHLPKHEEILIQLSQPIPIQFTRLEGKYLSKETSKSLIIELSPTSGVIVCNQPIDLLENIRFNLQINHKKASGLGDIYAKVLKQLPHQQNAFLVRFTAVPPEVAALFHYLCQTTTGRSQ